jgi:hypothetical protein
MTSYNPKIFGQVKPAAAHLNQGPYVVYPPQNPRAQVTLFVCNQDTNTDYFTIALLPAGSNINDLTTRYVANNTQLIGNGVFSIAGIGLGPKDTIQVSSTYGNLSFTATGIELD